MRCLCLYLIGFNSRDSNFHEIVEELLSHHDDYQLNKELGNATSRVAYVCADAQESGPDFIITRVSEKFSLFRNKPNSNKSSIF